MAWKENLRVNRNEQTIRNKRMLKLIRCCDASASLCHQTSRSSKAAAFNRRMRKTARTVVWEG